MDRHEIFEIMREREYRFSYREVYDGDTDDYLKSMVNVTSCPGINISVNEEKKKLGIPYFKVYNHENVDNATKVARLHFKDSGMEYHKDPLGKEVWELDNDEIKKIIELLKMPSGYGWRNNWQMLCYQWNNHNLGWDYSNNYYNLGAQDLKKYFTKKYDRYYAKDMEAFELTYVPSTQEMPDTWIYDPSKAKRLTK